MFWKPFKYNNKIYDLSHLEPEEITYTKPAKGNELERDYTVKVYYGLHCFTCGKKETNYYLTDLFYKGPRHEERVFDFERYNLSFRLPEIVKTLGERKCFHTNVGNFFTIDIAYSDGDRREYEVYFHLKKAKPKKLELYIESAYVRDKERLAERAKEKKIGFYVILYKIYNNQKIRRPR